MPRGIIEAEGKLIEKDYQHGKWSIEESQDRFLKDCRIRNLSNPTIQFYCDCFNSFNTFYKIKAPQITWVAAINHHDVEDYILWLVDKGVRDTSINSYMRGIAAWLNFLFKDGAVTSFPIPKRKVNKQQKETYTDEEIDKLLAPPEFPCRFSLYRAWVIENFLTYTGVRAETLINIRIKDIDFVNRSIYLDKIKTRKSYTIPMASTLVAILDRYINNYREAESPMDYLFCNEDGTKMERAGLISAVKRYNKSRGVSRTSIHAFRHYFATKAVRNGIDPYRLMKLLGHSTITMSQNYVDIEKVDFVSEIDSFTRETKKEEAPVKKFKKVAG